MATEASPFVDTRTPAAAGWPRSPPFDFLFVVGDDPPLLQKGVIYLLPLWGILHRSFQQPKRFLGQPIRVLPVPAIVVQVAAVVAVATVVVWMGRQLLAMREGRMPVAYTLYML